MDYSNDIHAAFVHLARFALEGRTNEVALLARRLLRRLGAERPDLAVDIRRILELSEATPALSRGVQAATALPVDADSRLELLRREDTVEISPDPVWAADVLKELDAVLLERAHMEQLDRAGLQPTRSMLFVGPPGVGKTLAARWMAAKLQRPLLTLDLAAVMSSFLGKTGANIKVVLDFAQRRPSVLLLDEFDAIAKRRDDNAEIGELKRLVTVLVQSIDQWPADGLLIAATNHPELLDPAVWRRFDRVVSFPLPQAAQIADVIHSLWGSGGPDDRTLALVAAMMKGKSFAEITRSILRTKRESVVRGVAGSEAFDRFAAEVAKEATTSVKLELAAKLRAEGSSQRKISEITGLSRDTLRKHLGSSV